jgi:integrase
LRAIPGERERLFDWGRPTIDRYFYAYFHSLQDACGIPKDEHFGFHQLRKTCATVWWEHNPQVAQFALGHTSMATTAGFYVRGQAMLARAVEQMPQPAAFNGKGASC